MRNISLVSALASAASLLVYTQASSADGSGMKIKGGVYFQRDCITSSSTICAFSSWRHPSPTSLFHDDVHKSPAAAAAKVFLPSSVYRKKQSAVVVKSTTIESGPNNQDTTTSKQQQQPSNDRLVIIIGGSGFLGTEIRHQLQERGINYIATTTPATFDKMNKDEKDNFVSLDLTSQDAQENFYNIISSVITEGNHNNDDDNDDDATTSTTAKEIAVIAAMGSIGTKDDEKVNSAIVEAIKGAHQINLKNKKNGSDNGDDSDDGIVKSFVTIGNTQRVRRLTRNVSFLKGYAAGKDEAEKTLHDLFGSKGCVIKPSFIYGGEEISLTPPRVPQNLGNLASEVLGLYPFQALADELPDVLALPLAPPISVEMVASAAINVALGIVEGYTEELEGKEAIVMAGSVRGWKEKSRYEDLLRQEYLKSIEEDGIGGEADDDVLYTSGKDSCSMDALMEMSDERRWARINELKDVLLRRNGNENVNDENDMEMMEELECLRPKSMVPADDPKLNGRWNFVLSKDDLGTQLIKELLPPDYHSIGSDVDNDGKLSSSSSTSSQSPPWKALLSTAYQLQGLYMLISDNQSRVEIVLSSKLFFGQIPFEIVFCTSLLATNYDEETAGLLFLEKFEDVELRFGKSDSSWKLPLPKTWQRFRHLEITFLDEEIVIARGSGGDPHILVRAK